MNQWQREMADKFLMAFGIARSNSRRAKVSYPLPSEHAEQRPSLFDRDLLTVSTGLTQRDERIRQLTDAEPFDIALVEQRIGRIDRIGPRFDHIEVLNLATVGSVEETISGRLWERLSHAAGIVGSQQYSRTHQGSLGKYRIQ